MIVECQGRTCDQTGCMWIAGGGGVKGFGKRVLTLGRCVHTMQEWSCLKTSLLLLRFDQAFQTDWNENGAVFKNRAGIVWTSIPLLFYSSSASKLQNLLGDLCESTWNRNVILTAQCKRNGETLLFLPCSHRQEYKRIGLSTRTISLRLISSAISFFWQTWTSESLTSIQLRKQALSTYVEYSPVHLYQKEKITARYRPCERVLFRYF